MRALSIKARWLSAAALAACACLTVSQACAQDAVTRANQGAYEWALKCFVANGSAAGTSKDGGDAAKAAAFEARARTSFDTASALADKLGYSGTRFNEDLGMTQTRELPRIVRDITYLRSTLATCKSLTM